MNVRSWPGVTVFAPDYVAKQLSLVMSLRKSSAWKGLFRGDFSAIVCLLFLMDVRDEYNSLASIYDRRWRHYVDVSVGRTLKALELGGDERVLDVGCGTGVLLERLGSAHPGLALHGVDPTEAMLDRARERCAERVDLKRGEAEALPFGDGEFDVVLSVSALHYFSDPRRAISEMARVLRPGGTLVVTGWCADFPAMLLYSVCLRAWDAAVKQIYRAEQVRGYLESAGIENVAATHFRIRPLWGMMMISARVKPDL